MLRFRNWLVAEQVVRDAGLVYHAKMLQKELLDPGCVRYPGGLAAVLYKALTCRDDMDKVRQRYDVWKPYYQEYQRLLTSLSIPGFGDGKQGTAWWGWAFDGRGVEARGTVGHPHNAFTVHFKRYFSFEPRPESKSQPEVWADMQRFLGALPEVGRVLAQIATRTGDPIQMKVPLNINTFLSHVDSLVVHYGEAANGPVIEPAVQQAFRTAGVPLGERGFRGNRGFDFKHPQKDGRYSDLQFGEGGSYTEVVSALLARQMGQEREQLLRMTPEQLAEWLKRAMGAATQLPPAEMHRQLYQAQGTT